MFVKSADSPRTMLKWKERVPMPVKGARPLKIVRRRERAGATTVHFMSKTQRLSARLYASPSYREGYGAGCAAARLLRANVNPYPPQDLRHLGWMDAFYDAWSARRVEISRASDHREIFRHRTVTDAVAPWAGSAGNL